MPTILHLKIKAQNGSYFPSDGWCSKCVSFIRLSVRATIKQFQANQIVAKSDNLNWQELEVFIIAYNAKISTAGKDYEDSFAWRQSSFTETLAARRINYPAKKVY